MAPYLGNDSSQSPAPGILPLPSFDKAFPHFSKDPQDLSRSVDPFTVNSTTGFLPTQLPVKDLPDVFKPLQNIIEDMAVLKLDGTAGYLAKYSLGPLIDSGKALPDLTDEIDDLVVPDTKRLDLHIITALFRDYSFLASSYLLEPCWQTWNINRQNKSSSRPTTTTDSTSGGCPHDIAGSREYGLGRPILPAAIARPLVKLAETLKLPPFMSYAASYALYNYCTADGTDNILDYANLRLIRAFEKGLDPNSSEAGFILTHIHMVALTGPLLKSVVDTLNGIENSSSHTNPTKIVPNIKSSLHTLLDTMTSIESNMDRMWANSRPADYPTYRTFIFGITSQPLFPNGVVYEGCFENKPQQFRGESGANDSIIPLLDNLCQVPMPRNPLTDILREFREYRPESQRSILTWTESKAIELGTREWFTKGSGDLGVAVLYLRVLNHIRSFRWRHWMFVREYIIKRSKYPVATGGSPIVTWLPNQLGAVLELMVETFRESGLMALVSEEKFDGGEVTKLEEGDKRIVKGIMEVVKEQKMRLEKEVRKYCEERGI